MNDAAAVAAANEALRRDIADLRHLLAEVQAAGDGESALALAAATPQPPPRAEGETIATPPSRQRLAAAVAALTAVAGDEAPVSRAPTVLRGGGVKWEVGLAPPRRGSRSSSLSGSSTGRGVAEAAADASHAEVEQRMRAIDAAHRAVTMPVAPPSPAASTSSSVSLTAAEPAASSYRAPRARSLDTLRPRHRYADTSSSRVYDDGDSADAAPDAAAMAMAHRAASAPPGTARRVIVPDDTSLLPPDDGWAGGEATAPPRRAAAAPPVRQARRVPWEAAAAASASQEYASSSRRMRGRRGDAAALNAVTAAAAPQKWQQSLRAPPRTTKSPAGTAPGRRSTSPRTGDGGAPRGRISFVASPPPTLSLVPRAGRASHRAADEGRRVAGRGSDGRADRVHDTGREDLAAGLLRARARVGALMRRCALLQAEAGQRAADATAAAAALHAERQALASERSLRQAAVDECELARSTVAQLQLEVASLRGSLEAERACTAAAEARCERLAAQLAQERDGKVATAAASTWGLRATPTRLAVAVTVAPPPDRGGRVAAAVRSPPGSPHWRDDGASAGAGRTATGITAQRGLISSRLQRGSPPHERVTVSPPRVAQQRRQDAAGESDRPASATRALAAMSPSSPSADQLPATSGAMPTAWSPSLEAGDGHDTAWQLAERDRLRSAIAVTERQLAALRGHVSDSRVGRADDAAFPPAASSATSVTSSSASTSSSLVSSYLEARVRTLLLGAQAAAMSTTASSDSVLRSVGAGGSGNARGIVGSRTLLHGDAGCSEDDDGRGSADGSVLTSITSMNSGM